MTPRDQKMALLLIGAMALTVGGMGGYLFVFDPIMKNRSAESALLGEITNLEDDAQKQAAKLKQLNVQRAQSLPADPTRPGDTTLARQEYFVALQHLVGKAIKAAEEEGGVPRGEIKSEVNAKVDNNARGTPEFTKGKPIYTKLAYTVIVKKANMWVVRDVLKAYYELDLLHQITQFTLKREDDNAKGPAKRTNLTMEFTTEALILDQVPGAPAAGAQYRRTLIAVPNAFGAAGGVPFLKVLEGDTEYGRGASARPSVPVLATKPRDYSLIVVKDPFNGPLPPPPPFKLSPPRDVTVKQDETPSPVKVAMSGEGAARATLRAVVSGTLYPAGELKTSGPSIELPKTSAESGTAKIDVIATSAEGKVEKTSFKVHVEKKKDDSLAQGPDVRDDVAGAIILTMLTIRHEDGTASAAIRDAANQQRYTIEVQPGGIKVVKQWFKSAKTGWAEDLEYRKQAAGVLYLSDETSKTVRTFKIVAVAADGLILEDLKPNGATKPEAAPAPGRGGPGRGGPGRGPGGFGGWPPKQGPANPVAALGGNMAVEAGAKVGTPKLYRWIVGQSLEDMHNEGELTETEAKKIIKQAADSGPMLEIAAVVK